MNVNILDFGAIGDGVTINTAQIQNAIDASGDYFFEKPKPFPPVNKYVWMYGYLNAKDPVTKRPGRLLQLLIHKKSR